MTKCFLASAASNFQQNIIFPPPQKTCFQVERIAAAAQEAERKLEQARLEKERAEKERKERAEQVARDIADAAAAEEARKAAAAAAVAISFFCQLEFAGHFKIEKLKV